jgi:ParB-like chromosome segregation protein Spo0J
VQPEVAKPSETLNTRRLRIEYLDINDIVPYEWNPRQNAEAVQSVANSIRLTQGMAMPVVIDADNVLIAGHTRVEACKLLGIDEVPVVRLSHLTPEQINAFRIIDNKVAEQAKWDHDLLAGEIAKLDGLFDWTSFGWSQGEIDCMSQLVAADCLNTESLAPVAQQAARTATAAAGSRAPRQARIVIGDIVTYIPIDAYRPWATGIRELCDFNDDAIAAEVKRRLGIIG